MLVLLGRRDAHHAAVNHTGRSFLDILVDLIVELASAEAQIHRGESRITKVPEAITTQHGVAEVHGEGLPETGNDESLIGVPLVDTQLERCRGPFDFFPTSRPSASPHLIQPRHVVQDQGVIPITGQLI